MSEADKILARQKIFEIDQKILACNNAKTSINNVKNTCQSEKDSWQTSYNRIANDGDLSNVKKTDIFEGEIADSLANYVRDILQDINDGLTKATNLVEQLEQQNTRLDQRITQLQQSRSYWSSKL